MSSQDLLLNTLQSESSDEHLQSQGVQSDQPPCSETFKLINDHSDPKAALEVQMLVCPYVRSYAMLHFLQLHYDYMAYMEYMAYMDYMDNITYMD